MAEDVVAIRARRRCFGKKTKHDLMTMSDDDDGVLVEVLGDDDKDGEVLETLADVARDGDHAEDLLHATLENGLRHAQRDVVPYIEERPIEFLDYNRLHFSAHRKWRDSRALRLVVLPIASNSWSRSRYYLIYPRLGFSSNSWSKSRILSSKLVKSLPGEEPKSGLRVFCRNLETFLGVKSFKFSSFAGSPFENMGNSKMGWWREA